MLLRCVLCYPGASTCQPVRQNLLPRQPLQPVLTAAQESCRPAPPAYMSVGDSQTPALAGVTGTRKSVRRHPACRQPASCKTKCADMSVPRAVAYSPQPNKTLKCSPALHATPHPQSQHFTAAPSHRNRIVNRVPAGKAVAGTTWPHPSTALLRITPPHKHPPAWGRKRHTHGCHPRVNTLF